jgi:hypothetical protein
MSAGCIHATSTSMLGGTVGPSAAVIGGAEILSQRDSPRFIVTILSPKMAGVIRSKRL